MENAGKIGPYLVKMQGADPALYFYGRCIVKGFRALAIAEALAEDGEYETAVVPGFYKTFPPGDWTTREERSAVFGCEFEHAGEEAFIDRKGRKRLRSIWRERSSYLDEPGQWAERIPATHCDETTARAYRAVVAPDVIQMKRRFLED